MKRGTSGKDCKAGRKSSLLGREAKALADYSAVTLGKGGENARIKTERKKLKGGKSQAGEVRKAQTYPSWKVLGDAIFRRV